MDGLSWLLLLFGLLVVAGVYFYSRRERERQERQAERPAPPARPPAERIEPSLDAAAEPPEADAPEAEPKPEPFALESAEAAAEPPAPRERKIVTLRVVAKRQGAFPGEELVLSLRGIGMRHGKFGIFHRYEGDDESTTIFSAASLVEPGSFDLADVRNQEIPGISLFMVLPGPLDGAPAFDLMMAAGRALAKTLDGELLDESGSTLSIQRERYLREEIIQYQHGIKVA